MQQTWKARNAGDSWRHGVSRHHGQPFKAAVVGKSFFVVGSVTLESPKEGLVVTGLGLTVFQVFFKCFNLQTAKALTWLSGTDFGIEDDAHTQDAALDGTRIKRQKICHRAVKHGAPGSSSELLIKIDRIDIGDALGFSASSQ